MDKFKLEKVELNSSGIKELLRSSDMRLEIQGRVNSALSRLGDGYAARVRDTGQRVAANLYASTDEARSENLENNTILKAVL